MLTAAAVLCQVAAGGGGGGGGRRRKLPQPREEAEGEAPVNEGADLLFDAVLAGSSAAKVRGLSIALVCVVSSVSDGREGGKTQRLTI